MCKEMQTSRVENSDPSTVSGGGSRVSGGSNTSGAAQTLVDWSEGLRALSFKVLAEQKEKEEKFGLEGNGQELDRGMEGIRVAENEETAIEESSLFCCDGVRVSLLLLALKLELELSKYFLFSVYLKYGFPNYIIALKVLGPGEKSKVQSPNPGLLQTNVN